MNSKVIRQRVLSDDVSRTQAEQSQAFLETPLPPSTFSHPLLLLKYHWKHHSLLALSLCHSYCTHHYYSTNSIDFVLIKAFHEHPSSFQYSTSSTQSHSDVSLKYEGASFNNITFPLHINV